MARQKKTDVELPPPAETVPSEHGANPVSDTNGTNEKTQPVFKVGPIATDRNNAVQACVWANVHTDKQDGREYTVYSIQCSARWRDADGNWKDGKSYRGSQIYALVYCLQKCSEWILAQRDPQQSSPF